MWVAEETPQEYLKSGLETRQESFTEIGYSLIEESYLTVFYGVLYTYLHSPNHLLRVW